jgi:hypothetical protein
MGTVFSSNLTTLGVSVAAELRGKTEEQQQPQIYKVALAGPATMGRRVPPSLLQYGFLMQTVYLWTKC